MASMLENALAMHTRGLLAGMGKAAIYRRGASPSCSSVTDLAIQVIDQGTGNGKQSATKLGDSPDSTDYVIFTPELGYWTCSVQVSDLASLILPIPMRGDKILIGDDVYAVLAPDGLNVWRWEDLPYKRFFRVHTKLS